MKIYRKLRSISAWRISMINVSDLSYLPKEIYVPASECVSFTQGYISQTKAMAVMIGVLTLLLGYMIFREIKNKGLHAP